MANFSRKDENKLNKKILLEKLANLSYKNKTKTLNDKNKISIEKRIKQNNSNINEENKENIIINKNKNYSFIIDSKGGNNNIKYKKCETTNKIKNNRINKNIKFLKNIIHKENIYNNKNNENIIKNKFNYRYKKEKIIKYIIIYILFSLFNNIDSKINLSSNKNLNGVTFSSYEIKLKLKGTGIKNILGSSSSYSFTCPSNIDLIRGPYLNITDCHYISIDGSENEIKLIWNNIVINSTKGMFYNCKEITEIDMTKFDTSLVTDMSFMFAYCSSLKVLKATNLNTTKVETFQNMFFQCINLESINLESFTNPSATSLYRMFYGCENLEYINIKNFEEKENMNIDEMFYNIPINSVICLLSCPPPTNFTVTDITDNQVTISWEGYEFKKFVISYDSQNLSNPEEGNKINITDKTYYILTNLNSDRRYYIYIKTDCNGRSSYWLGPLLISFGSYTMYHTGTHRITTCSKVIYDPGGPNGNYYNHDDSTLIINPEISGRLISIKGSINTESCCDYLHIYDGIRTGEKLLSYYNGVNNIPLIASISGPLTLYFRTDGSVVYSGFKLTIGCIINTKTIYSLIKDNNCRIISCDNTGININNLLVLNKITCDSNYGFNFISNDNYNCYPRCDNYYYFDQDNNYICLNNTECPNDYNYLIKEKNQCVSECKLYPGYHIDFQKNCYNSCPINTSEITIENEYYNETKCPNYLPYEIIKDHICVKYCNILQISSNECKLNIESNNENDSFEAQEKMVENIREEITNSLDISVIGGGKDILIQEKDITVTITNSDNQKNQLNTKTNSTSIDLGECETKLKEYYNISKNESLYILKMDVKQEGYKIPKIQYEVYYPLNQYSKLSLLNLSICESTNINIYLPIELNSNLALYDTNSDFYNDICNTYTSENGTDLTLSERKNNYINNNLALCEENCYLEEYNENIERAKCSCKTKTEFVNKISENTLNKEELLKAFTDFNNIFNIKVLECMNLIFSIKAFKENYANIILIFIIALYFICLIIFIFKSYKNEINFYVNMIIYFTFFPFNILKNTINTQTSKYHEKNNLKENEIINKKFNNKNKKLMIKPPLFNIILEANKKSLIKFKQANKIRKKRAKYMIKFKKKIINKKKLEENIKEKCRKYNINYDNIDKLNKNQIYELYIKFYSKTDNELNDLSYQSALKYDKRTYFKLYLSLLKSNHLLLFSFLPNFDFNSRIIKIYLFFFNFATFFFVNTLFFTDETMGKINTDGGAFNIIYNLPQIIYSSFISMVITELIKIFTLTESSFITFRNKAKKENVLYLAKNLKKIFKIKFIIFFIVDFILLVCFWIYLSCFSAVYRNTQIHLIKDTLISFGTSFISPIFTSLLPGLFRIPSLKNKNRKILYSISQIVQLF